MNMNIPIILKIKKNIAVSMLKAKDIAITLNGAVISDICDCDYIGNIYNPICWQITNNTGSYFTLGYDYIRSVTYSTGDPSTAILFCNSNNGVFFDISDLLNSTFELQTTGFAQNSNTMLIFQAILFNNAYEIKHNFAIMSFLNGIYDSGFNPIISSVTDDYILRFQIDGNQARVGASDFDYPNTQFYYTDYAPFNYSSSDIFMITIALSNLAAGSNSFDIRLSIN